MINRFAGPCRNPRCAQPSTQVEEGQGRLVGSRGDYAVYHDACVAVLDEDPMAKFAGFEPSDYQQAVLEAWTGSQAHLVVNAVAGSGKTKTILWLIAKTWREGVRALRRDPRVLLCCFNKEIQQELVRRVHPGTADARTLNSLGYRMLKQHLSRLGFVITLDKKKLYGVAGRLFPRNERELKEHWDGDMDGATVYQILWHEYPKGLESWEFEIYIQRAYQRNEAWHDALVSLAGLRRATLSNDDAQLAAAYSVDLPWVAGTGVEEVDADCEAGLTPAVTFVLEEMKRMALERGVVDYDDQVWLPVLLGLRCQPYDAVFVDEAQDLNEAQLQLLFRATGSTGRMVCVGDPFQCAPPGSMVRTPDRGEVPIEDLVDGDAVVAFSRHSKAIVGRKRASDWVDVASRHYSGDLVHVKCSGRETRTTPNHRWLVRWSSRSPRTFVVYLMRKGEKFRIGRCQLFTEQDGSYHLGRRALVERADAAWILKAFDDKREASIYESVVAAEWGLPTLPFHAPPVNKLQTQEATEAVFAELIRRGKHKSRAIECLSDHGRDIDCPLWPAGGKKYKKSGRTTLFETFASNLIPGLMSIPVPVGETRHVTYEALESVERKQYSGPVYSLNVRKNGLYIQDGLVTHNSIYSFRGAGIGMLDHVKRALAGDRRRGVVELPLNYCYRCPTAVIDYVHKTGHVMHIQAAPGAEVGEVATVKDSRHWDSPVWEQILAAKDVMILCRTNAPLVSAYFKLIRKKIPSSIRGRGDGGVHGNLLALIRRCKGKGDLAGLMKRATARCKKQIEILWAAKRHGQVMSISDLFEVLLTLSEESDSLADLRNLADEVFKGDKDMRGITLSTVHKAKGLEENTVVVIRPDLLPMTFYARTENEIAQERNLQYVCYTRAKKRLVIASVEGASGKAEFVRGLFPGINLGRK